MARFVRFATWVLAIGAVWMETGLATVGGDAAARYSGLSGAQIVASKRPSKYHCQVPFKTALPSGIRRAKWPQSGGRLNEFPGPWVPEPASVHASTREVLIDTLEMAEPHYNTAIVFAARYVRRHGVVAGPRPHPFESTIEIWPRSSLRIPGPSGGAPEP